MHLFRNYQAAVSSSNWLSALRMFSAWIEVVKVDSFEVKVMIDFSVLDVMTFKFILKNKGSHLLTSGIFIMFSSTFVLSLALQDCSKNNSDHSRF